MAGIMSWAEFKQTSPYSEAKSLFLVGVDGWYYKEDEVESSHIVEGWTFNDLRPGELIVLLK